MPAIPLSASLSPPPSLARQSFRRRKERTEWHNIVIFNENLGKIAEQYCKKDKIYLEGQLQTREYTDRDGNQRQGTDVVLTRFRGELTLLDSRGRGDAGGAFEASNNSFGRASSMEQAPDRAPSARSSPTADIIDDDIPF